MTAADGDRWSPHPVTSPIETRALIRDRLTPEEAARVQEIAARIRVPHRYPARTIRDQQDDFEAAEDRIEQEQERHR